MNVTIIAVGALRDSFYREAAAEYEKRLSAFCKLKTIETTDEKLASVIPQKAYKIALCVEGKELSSEELADKIDKVSTNIAGDICFVIGGFDGLTEEIKSMCDFRLSFSRMTFPHRLMRVFLLEQIYRAFTIINHLNYHH